MATGDAALAAGMSIMTGGELANTLDTEVNLTRDYIAERTSAVTPIAKGGTGSTSVNGARTALGLSVEQVWKNSGAVGGGYAPLLGFGGTRLQYEVPGYAFPTDLANYADVAGKVSAGTDVTFNHIYTPAGRSTPVNTSYVAAYLNSDGRLGATPSALKYKRDVADWEGSVMDLRAVTYVLKDDELGTPRLGVIADEANDVEPMLVVHEDGEIESFKYELLAVGLLKEVQRLNERVSQLEG